MQDTMVLVHKAGFRIRAAPHGGKVWINIHIFMLPNKNSARDGLTQYPNGRWGLPHLILYTIKIHPGRTNMLQALVDIGFFLHSFKTFGLPQAMNICMNIYLPLARLFNFWDKQLELTPVEDNDPCTCVHLLICVYLKIGQGFNFCYHKTCFYNIIIFEKKQLTLFFVYFVVPGFSHNKYQGVLKYKSLLENSP